MKDLDKKAKAYALKNAIAHEGTASAGPVISALFNEGLKKEDVKKYVKDINKIILEINELDLKDQEIEFKKSKKFVSEREVREGLQELPDVKKSGVVMRFAPSASGPMHVGHAMTSCLSYLYVKKYGGKLYVRIEDTNPENIDKDSYKMLKEDSDWLFKRKAEFIIQSDRIKIYYKYVEKLLDKEAVYICTCSGDDFREFSKNKKNCPCRKKSKKENKQGWKDMFDKTKFKSGDAVLRFKTPGEGMKHKNPAMRDFPLVRISDELHVKQGTKYRVWPLMNLAVTVDDIETKITHSIRGKDHRDNAERQKLIFEVLGKKFPWIGFLGKFKFKDMDLSTTKMREGIETGKYSGWDDENLPTLISLKNKGYKPSAFWKFAERIGLSENDKVMDKKEYFTLLNSFNRE